MKSVLLPAMSIVLIALLLTGCGPAQTPTSVSLLPTPILTTEPTATPEPAATPSAIPSNTPALPSATPTQAPEPTANPYPETAGYDQELEAMTWRDEQGDLWLWDSEAEETIRLGRLAGYELKEEDRDRRFAGAEFAPLSEYDGRVFTFGALQAPVILTPQIHQKLDQQLSQWGIAKPDDEDILRALWMEGREWVEILNQVGELPGYRDLHYSSSLVLVDNEGSKGIAVIHMMKKAQSGHLYVGRYYYVNSLGEATSEVIKLPDYDNDEVYGGKYYSHNVRVHGERIVLDDGLRAAAELRYNQLGRPAWHEFSREEMMAGDGEIFSGQDLVEAIRVKMAEKLGDDGTWRALKMGNDVLAAVKQGGAGGLTKEHADLLMQAFKRMAELDPELPYLFTRWYGLRVVTGNTKDEVMFDGDRSLAVATFDKDVIYLNQYRVYDDKWPEYTGYQKYMYLILVEGDGIGLKNQRVVWEFQGDIGRSKGAFLEDWILDHQGNLTLLEREVLEYGVDSHKSYYGSW